MSTSKPQDSFSDLLKQTPTSNEKNAPWSVWRALGHTYNYWYERHGLKRRMINENRGTA